jgi:membrane-bound serine protease (ClpP class)
MRIWAGMILLGLLTAMAWGQVEAPATAPTTAPAATAPAAKQAAVISIDGMVDDYMYRILRARLAEAREDGAQVVVLKLNTYGGLVTSGIDISRLIKQQTDLHIICFVHEKAISAGSMIALACNEIVMEPSSLLGDSGVISMGEEMGEVERAKAESLVLEEFADSAERNGYSELLARAFIVVPATVYYIQNNETGERRFVDEAEYNRLVGGPATQPSTQPATAWSNVEGVRVPLDGKDTLLTVRADLAKRVGLATGVYPTVEALAADRGYNIIAQYTPSTGERLVGILGSYTARGFLMLIFMLSAYAAIQSPGTGLAEVACVGALAILLGVPMLTGLATWWEIALVVLGVLLLLMEIFVIPGFGLPGITGIFMILGGLTMTFVPPIKLPDTPIGYGVDWSWLGRGIVTTVIAMTASLVLWAWLSRYLPRLPYFNRLVLQAPGDAATVGAGQITAPPPQSWPTRGMTGRVVADLRPGGLAEFMDEAINDVRTVDVVCDCGFVPRGTEVTVREVHGNRVVVRPVNTQATT